MTRPQPLRGSHALVSGATGPFARALAVAVAEAGAAVSVTTLHDDRAEEVQANSILNECWAAGAQGQARTVDLTDRLAVEAAVEALEREVAPIDLLVHAAASAPEPAPWSEALAAGSAAFVVAQVVGARMRARSGGRIVVALPAGRDATADAVRDFARALAATWGTAEGAAAVTIAAIAVTFTEQVAPVGLREALLSRLTDETAQVDGGLQTVDVPIAYRAS